MRKKLLKILILILVLIMMGGSGVLTAEDATCKATAGCGAKCDISGSNVECSAGDDCAWCSGDTEVKVVCCAS